MSYLPDIANYHPDAKDAVIERLTALYSWKNNDKFFQSLANNFVNLMVKYPYCVRDFLLGKCDWTITDTIRSFWYGIAYYRCNVPQYSEALSSETPPIEILSSETPPSEILSSETPPNEDLSSETPPNEVLSSETPPSEGKMEFFWKRKFLTS
jgi:hypothetical protein